MILPSRFMVVDDMPINNLLCQRTLRKFSAQTEAVFFDVPQEALNFIEEKYSNADINISTILFLDINMPSMSGWDFLEEFQKLEEHIHKQFTIFMLSSSIDDTDRDRATSNRFVEGFITKPLLKENLEDLFPDRA